MVAEVLEVTAHPSADRLRVCTLDIGADEPIRVVTNAADATAGRRVFVAVRHGDLSASVMACDELSFALVAESFCAAGIRDCWQCAAAWQRDSEVGHQDRGSRRQGRAEPRYAVLARRPGLGRLRQQGARCCAGEPVGWRCIPSRASHGAMSCDASLQDGAANSNHSLNQPGCNATSLA